MHASSPLQGGMCASVRRECVRVHVRVLLFENLGSLVVSFINSELTKLHLVCLIQNKGFPCACVSVCPLVYAHCIPRERTSLAIAHILTVTKDPVTTTTKQKFSLTKD